MGRYQLDAEAGRLTPAERVARGKAARAEVPRARHAVFDPPPDRPDPIGLWNSRRVSGCPSSCRCGGAVRSSRPPSPATARPMRQFAAMINLDVWYAHVDINELRASQGQRVVAGQRLMQAASDIFLGWQRVEAGMDGRIRDFYVRQLRDWKFSVDIESLRPEGLRMYAEPCGWTLARGHARSGRVTAEPGV